MLVRTRVQSRVHGLSWSFVGVSCGAPTAEYLTICVTLTTVGAVAGAIGPRRAAVPAVCVVSRARSMGLNRACVGRAFPGVVSRVYVELVCVSREKRVRMSRPCPAILQGKRKEEPPKKGRWSLDLGTRARSDPTMAAIAALLLASSAAAPPRALLPVKEDAPFKRPSGLDELYTLDKKLDKTLTALAARLESEHKEKRSA